jgi:ribosome-associated protein
MRKKTVSEDKKLLEHIFEGILKIKGKKIVCINLQKLEHAVCDYFVICSGESSTQVSSIAESVVEQVRDQLNLRPGHKEGFENAQWVLIDYGYVVVHVFQDTQREFYKLEDLWADGEVSLIAEN